MKNFIIEKLKEEATDNDIINWWNEFCSWNCYEDQIYTDLEELADLLNDTPIEFARKIFFGNVQSWGDNYFILNGYANIESFNHFDDENSPIDFRMLAQWLIDDQPNYIEDWIDEWEDQQNTAEEK